MIPTGDTIVTGLFFVPQLCENAAKDLEDSFNNVIHALGALQVEVVEGDYKSLIHYGKLSLDTIQLLNNEYCAPSVIVMGVSGPYKYFTQDSNKCELVLRPLED